MASSRSRKLEEKHLKILRELASREPNKKCFDCGQRGPTYVNMTVGSFVCTSCSGVLRGLNPPHRVKSISMASYTPQEIELLQNSGNDHCKQTWLGLWDSPMAAEPESRDEQKVRDFMVQKYERKRWYVSHPLTPPANKQQQQQQQQPDAKPLKTLLGKDPPPISIQNNSPSSRTIKSPPSLAGAQPTPFAQTQQTAGVQRPHAAAPTKQSSFDLLGDLGSDPFSSGTTTQANNAAAAGGGGGGFASFDQAFGSGGGAAVSTAPSSGGFNAFGSAAPVAHNPTSVLQPTNQPVAASSSQSQLNWAAVATAATGSPQLAVRGQQQQRRQMGGDRYAALSELDTLFSTTTSSGGTGTGGGGGGEMPPAFNWAGGGGAPSSAAAPGGWPPSASTTTTSAASGFGTWPAQAPVKAQQAVGGGGGGGGGASNPFNPFMGQQPQPAGMTSNGGFPAPQQFPQQAMAVPPGAFPQQQPGQPQQQQQQQFYGQMQQQQPAAAAAMFGMPQANPMFGGQMPVQQQQLPQQPAMFGQQPRMQPMPPQQQQSVPTSYYGQQPQQPAQFGGAAASNPFMASGIPNSSQFGGTSQSSTNPFL